jgi:hypothetical protein
MSGVWTCVRRHPATPSNDRTGCPYALNDAGDPHGPGLARPAARAAGSAGEGVRLAHAGSSERVIGLEPPLGEPQRPVTIAAIAKSAGVSVPTVSKVINGRSVWQRRPGHMSRQ